MSEFVINIDRDRCMGAGECVFSGPNTFALDDDVKAVVINVDGDGEAAIRTAVRGCPNFAITAFRNGEPIT